MEDSGIVAALSIQLAERIGSQRFDAWFGAQTTLRIAGTHLTVHASSKFVCDWLRKNLANEISCCWSSIAGESVTIEFVHDDALLSAPQAGQTAAANPPVAKNESSNVRLQQPELKFPNADKRSESLLERFVVGPSNEYAFRAAELTAYGRQQACPLLFLGPTGVGKTHLLKSIQREFRRRHPHSMAVYLSAEQFTTCFIEAVRGSGLPSFRQKCRGSQLLLIDDLQFFAGKPRTIEELQHTVDTMLAEGRQLVLASDRTPAELRSLGPELASRISGGLTCEIEPPEFATRCEIVRQLSAEIGVSVCEEVVSIIATRVTSGAREIRGALHRLHAINFAGNEPITSEAAKQGLADLARHNTRPVRLEDVQKVVCNVFGVEPAQLRSERKGRSVSEPRMLAMWLARKYTRAAWSEIGSYFGRRSHSTVISAHRRVEKLIGSHGQIEVSDRECGVEETIRKLEAALRTA
jgi:chromosomal replication initiator protein